MERLTKREIYLIAGNLELESARNMPLICKEALRRCAHNEVSQMANVAARPKTIALAARAVALVRVMVESDGWVPYKVWLVDASNLCETQ